MIVRGNLLACESSHVLSLRAGLAIWSLVHKVKKITWDYRLGKVRLSLVKSKRHIGDIRPAAAGIILIFTRLPSISENPYIQLR